ncbi:MAG: nuclear transport factor 2 family protein [Bryobacteraceae bacterium]
MNRTEAEAYAQDWIRDWCARNVEGIVSHFAEDAQFVSPVAAKRTGNALVVGREALTAYWQVVHSFGSFRFTLERVIWDEAGQEMVIVYTRDIDGRRDRACELLRFNASGEVAAGEAMYGAEGV